MRAHDERHDADADDQPEQQVPPPHDDGETRDDADRLDPDVELLRAVRRLAHEGVRGGERREHRRPDQAQVEQRLRRQALDARGEHRHRPRRVGDRRHQDARHEPDSSQPPDPSGRRLSKRLPDASPSRASRADGRPSLGSARVGRPSPGTAIADQRPQQPAGDDPDRRPDHERQTTPIAAPGPAATSSRRPGHEPRGEAGHGGRKDDVEPERRRVRDRAAEQDPPAIVARFHGMNTATTAAIQYPRMSTRPIRWKCVAERANASSVRTWAIAAALAPRDVAHAAGPARRCTGHGAGSGGTSGRRSGATAARRRRSRRR